MKTTEYFDHTALTRRVRQQLDHGAQALTLRQQHRLAQARKTALAHQRQALHTPLVLAHAGHAQLQEHPKVSHWATAITCLLILIGGLLALHSLEQDKRVEELADIDAAVLTDDLPMSAYLDHGFKRFAQAQNDE